MTTFILPDSTPPCPVSIPGQINREQLLRLPAFKTWIATLQNSLSLQQKSDQPFHQSPYLLRSIEVQAVDLFGPNRIGFVKLKADISTDQGDWLPGAVFMRGGSVAMLVCLQEMVKLTLCAS